MPLFRKKPIVIEAMQFPPADDDRRAFFDSWVSRKSAGREDLSWFEDGCFVMTTAQGQQVRARPGEWIIPDGKPGYFYPCDATIFAQTYEKAS